MQCFFVNTINKFKNILEIEAKNYLFSESFSTAIRIHKY